MGLNAASVCSDCQAAESILGSELFLMFLLVKKSPIAISF
jgi:hypothetical protein